MSDGASVISASPTGVDPTRGAGAAPPQAGQAPKVSAKDSVAGGDSLTLSPQAKALVDKLQARDADVRSHEEAHVAAGGNLITSGVSFSYEKGPDGRMYAIGGDVGIDTSPVSGNPQATVAKAQRIEAAALAPADPSGQDESVASQAAAMAANALAQEAAPGAGTQASGSEAGPSAAGGQGSTQRQAGAAGTPGKVPGALFDAVV